MNRRKMNVYLKSYRFDWIDWKQAMQIEKRRIAFQARNECLQADCGDSLAPLLDELWQVMHPVVGCFRMNGKRGMFAEKGVSPGWYSVAC